MQSLVVDGKAYIRNADGRAELYDLISDPAEVHDLAGSSDPLGLPRLRDRVQSLLEESRSK